MKGYTTGIAYRRDSKTPYVEVWEQPWYLVVITNIYSFWLRSTWKIVQAIEPYEKDIHEWWWGEHVAWLDKLIRLVDRREATEYMPLGCRQDCRYFELEHKKKVSHGTLNLTQEQYDTINGISPEEGNPPHNEIRAMVQEGVQ